MAFGRKALFIITGLLLAMAGVAWAVTPPATSDDAAVFRQVCEAALRGQLSTADRTWAQRCARVGAVAGGVLDSPSPSPSSSPSPSPSPSGSPTPTPSPSPTVSPSPTPSPSPSPTAGPSPTSPVFGCPVFPAIPDQDCTGWRHTGVTLHDCPLTLTAASYDSCRFNGSIVVASSNVQVSRSLVLGHVEGAGYDLRGLILTDVEVSGSADNMAAIGNSNWTCLRCDVHDGQRGFALGNNVRVEDSYAHDFAIIPGAHQTAASTHGSSNVTVLHSNLQCNSDAYACSSAMSFYSEDAPGISGFTVRHNLFNTDAGYCVFFASLTAGKPYGITNVMFIDNLFGKLFRSGTRCGEYGPLANWPESQAGNTWSGNVYQDGSGPVLP